jgi:hypothetical protein
MDQVSLFIGASRLHSDFLNGFAADRPYLLFCALIIRHVTDGDHVV